MGVGGKVKPDISKAFFLDSTAPILWIDFPEGGNRLSQRIAGPP